MTYANKIYEFREKNKSLLAVAKNPTFKIGLNMQFKPKSFSFEDLDEFKTEKPYVEIHSDSITDELLLLVFEDLFKFNNFTTNEKINLFHEAYSNINVYLLENNETKILNVNNSDQFCDENKTLMTDVLIIPNNSKATIIIDDELISKLTSHNVKIFVSENSTLNLGIKVNLQNLDNLKNSEMFKFEKKLFSNILIIGKENSNIDVFSFVKKSNFAKITLTTILDGLNSNVNLTKLFTADNNSIYDINTIIKHNTKLTKSNVVAKGIVSQSSKALLRGLINIGENAPKSEGYEKIDILLIGDDAEADAIPDLEINNDDVKCSHGSTIGEIDKDKLFYIMSRGLSRNEATNLIIDGFFAKELRNINKELKDYFVEVNGVVN